MHTETLQEIIGLVTHSLNNHISGIYGMAQLAQATHKEEYSEKTVEISVESCKKISEIWKKCIYQRKKARRPQTEIDTLITSREFCTG